jgi:hypothetical protein
MLRTGFCTHWIPLHYLVPWGWQKHVDSNCPWRAVSLSPGGYHPCKTGFLEFGPSKVCSHCTPNSPSSSPSFLRPCQTDRIGILILRWCLTCRSSRTPAMHRPAWGGCSRYAKEDSKLCKWLYLLGIGDRLLSPIHLVIDSFTKLPPCWPMVSLALRCRVSLAYIIRPFLQGFGV